MGTNHEIDYKYLRDRMLSGELTSAEKDDLVSYIQATFQDHQLDLLMREHWLGMENQEIAADEMQIQLIKNQILSKINQKINSSKKECQLFPSNWKNYLLRIAAVLFIPLLLGSVLVIYRLDQRLDQKIALTANQRVTANPGSRVHFTLPDQTEVWLNSGSMIEYPIALNLQRD